MPCSDLPCVVMAAGRSRRFGSEKAFATINGERLVDILVKTLESQTSGPIAINAAAPSQFQTFENTILTDRVPGGIEPLAGIYTALDWAEENGFDNVITTPVDTPILPKDFVEKLRQTGAPAVSRHGGRIHAVHGIWPTSLKADLADSISVGVRAVRDWAIKCGATLCDFPHDSGRRSFFNINTRQDLLELMRVQRDR